MDDTFAFVWGHIKIGRSSAGGGKSEPEFPQSLIREIVNNALAHRDYTINKFVTIKINPGINIEIKNPGIFKQKMLITDLKTQIVVRRIIPGIPETKNPKLANVLKAFEKIESQGIGMAKLVSECLENNIDVPYYDLLIPDTMSLIIPSGKLIDDDTQTWLNSFGEFIDEKLDRKASPEHKLVLSYLFKSERLNQKRLYTILLSPNNNHANVLNDLKNSYLISEHSTSSTEQTPIYIVNRELLLTDFISLIEKQIGMELKSFDDSTKKILNIIYKNNHYNRKSLRPNQITLELYSLLYGKEILPSNYESLGRKICADMFKQSILTKKTDKSYEINVRN